MFPYYSYKSSNVLKETPKKWNLFSDLITWIKIKLYGEPPKINETIYSRFLDEEWSIVLIVLICFSMIIAYSLYLLNMNGDDDDEYNVNVNKLKETNKLDSKLKNMQIIDKQISKNAMKSIDKFIEGAKGSNENKNKIFNIGDGIDNRLNENDQIKSSKFKFDHNKCVPELKCFPNNFDTKEILEVYNKSGGDTHVNTHNITYPKHCELEWFIQQSNFIEYSPECNNDSINLNYESNEDILDLDNEEFNETYIGNKKIIKFPELEKISYDLNDNIEEMETNDNENENEMCWLEQNEFNQNKEETNEKDVYGMLHSHTEGINEPISNIEQYNPIKYQTKLLSKNNGNKNIRPKTLKRNHIRKFKSYKNKSKKAERQDNKPKTIHHDHGKINNNTNDDCNQSLMTQVESVLNLTNDIIELKDDSMCNNTKKPFLRRSSKRYKIMSKKTK